MSLLRERLPRLDAGAFAFVMATGIVSVAAAAQGFPVISDALLVLACVSWVALAVFIAVSPLRARSRPRLQAFALVAATAVIGSRFALAGANVAALVLLGVAVALWALLLAQRPAFTGIRGGSLLLVVATESLAVLAALVALHSSVVFLFVAFAGWALGLALYPPVIAAIVLAQRDRRRFDPDLWIVMGALAIATLAGSKLLLGARDLHRLHLLRVLLPDIDLATWATASALIAGLVVVELWTRSQWRYEASRWSFVFPLGMYAVASHALSRVDGVDFLDDISLAFFALALAAWAVVLLGFAKSAHARR